MSCHLFRFTFFPSSRPPHEEGGLGVRRLREFTVALLGKWCWRMLVDKEGLWYRVLKARYGEEGGRLKEGRRDSSVWWRMLSAIRSGVRSGEGASLRRTSVEWLVEGVAHIFGWTTGWGAHPYMCVFHAYSIWLKINGRR